MSLFIRSNKRESGFTLIELLLVITILGFMVAMVVPFANHQDKESKIKETNQIFEEIRMAILGARNSFDAEGNRVIGGYVGDVGHLPKLYVYEWDDTNKEWTYPDTTPADGEPDTTANNDPGTPIAGEKSAEPAALWKGTLPGGYAADALKEEGWKGPYMAKPKDRFRDDQVWDYIASPSTADDFEQNRKFRIREAEGRLSDAWGKTFIIYVEGGAASMDSDNNPLNLVFVSAGPDGRYDYEDPADLNDPNDRGNDDNLVFKIERSEWDDTAQKIVRTQNLLNQLKEGVVGSKGLYTGGELQHTGFVVDMGNLGPLCGSIVKDPSNSHAYKCIKTKTDVSAGADQPSSGGGGAYWLDLGLVTATNYPHAPDWVAGEHYFASTPELLQVHEDHATHNGTNYKCKLTHTSGSVSEPGVGGSWSTYWEVDNSVKGPSWQSGEDYFDYEKDASTNDLLPKWKHYPTCKMWAGWRGPYLKPQAELPLKDAWGREIEFEWGSDRNITIRSGGPDGSTTTDDDLTVLIARTEYEVPVELDVYDYTGTPGTDGSVSVKDLSTASDIIDVYVPFNGGIRLRRVWAENGAQGTGPGGSTPFCFNDNVPATGILNPIMPGTVDPDGGGPLPSDYAPIRSETSGTPCTDPNDPTCSKLAAGCRYGTTFLPIGNRYFVFREDQYTSNAGADPYGSPYPDKNHPNSYAYTVDGFTDPGPSGYQKLVTLHPGTETMVSLKAP